MLPPFGQFLREDLARRPSIPFIGVYDVFSASLAAKHFDALFVSGFSFAASYYGLPDIGFIAWPDIVAFTQRIRTVLPRGHILVDIDDGYCDVAVAAHATAMLEAVGASGVILEDQLRPKKCGHLDGKQIMDLDGYLEKLNRVLESRNKLFVVARTDASNLEEMVLRARAFDKTDADAILIDGLRDLEHVRLLRREIRKPLGFNQIVGGKSRPFTWSELRDAGATLMICSTPCLFSAQAAIEREMKTLLECDGRVEAATFLRVPLAECCSHLDTNLRIRHEKT